jgi:folate-dependent phosphoribosylglycinamide formyltransferase PurN
MKIKLLKDKIVIKNKIFSNLDKFVIDFTSILTKEKIEYVIVSGYLSILFGRNRTSEDVDIIVKKIDYRSFEKL